jgi:uncharacterized protein YlxW (UPF0749 family)
MRKIALIAALAMAGAMAARGAEPAPASAPPDRRIADLAEDLREAQNRIADLQKRLDEVEGRLGDSYRAVSPFDTVERRLEDLEKDVQDLKRR